MTASLHFLYLLLFISIPPASASRDSTFLPPFVQVIYFQSMGPTRESLIGETYPSLVPRDEYKLRRAYVQRSGNATQDPPGEAGEGGVRVRVGSSATLELGAHTHTIKGDTQPAA